ncbi:MAG: hypothetical protein ACKO1V_06525 [Cyanobium sp.]
MIEFAYTKLYVDDVVKTINFYEQAIEAGATLYASPKEKPWGQIARYVRDLDGFLIEICTPID